MRLAGKIAVVTGAGQGLGAEIARRFAAEGAAVAVLDIDGQAAATVAQAITTAGGHAGAYPCDVTRRDMLEEIADAAARDLGPLDIWVNNAGVSCITPFLECTEALWDRTLGVNLKGTFLGCQAALRRMVPRRTGVILNMSSQSGKVGNSQYAAYCASKFGVIGLTQSMAVEFAGAGIRVNALCPGVVFTPLWETMKADYARKRNLEPDEVRPYLESRIPLGRLGEPGDVAALAVFLASDEAAYITGQAINVSGGAVMH